VRSTLARYALLLIATISGVLVIVLARRHSPSAVALVTIAAGASGVLAWKEQRNARVKLGAVVAAITIVFAAALASPPRSSADLWSYTIYGRIVSVHGASPYETVPVNFRSDPLFKKVSPAWRHRGSVFGPVYVGFAAAGTAAVGTSPLANRLFFQITAAIAAAAVLWLVWRRTRSPGALIWLGLHPVFADAVNGGHNDMFVGLAVLGAALLANRRRGWLAGLVIGVVALVKLTGLLALVGIVIWAWRQRERRVAVTAVISASVTIVVGYAPFLGGAAHVLSGADKTVTPASLWNPLAALLIGHNGGRDIAHPLAPNTTLTVIAVIASVTVAIVALTLGWRAAIQRRADTTIGVTTASYTVAAEYTFPWYAVWALPVLTERKASALAWVVWIQAAVMLAAWRLPLHPDPSVLDTTVRGSLTYAAPIVCFIAFVVVGLRSNYGPVRSSDDVAASGVMTSPRSVAPPRLV